ncbi:hypothetical protein PVAND_000148 [Polypedilum vanderplanki]|uniref:Peptidase S1 domain-containing protein n=1 Tax=Polypedilum vanderplanki TaxID=319348 RepID=A0A9J6BIY8_POLVA|nr:hypothetical protein PVAND_000148 [Polypedilum vanderplanki]
MKILIIWFLFELLISSVENFMRLDCACGESNIFGPKRIVNGQEVLPHFYPWIAVMLSPKGNHVCSGSIVSDRMILTAGHCVYYSKEPLEIKWMVALHSVSKSKALPENIYKTVLFQLHPKFLSAKLFDSYDLALVTVDRPITFNEFTTPICLPEPYEHMRYFNKKVIIAGWGKIQNLRDSPVSDVLLESRVILKTPEMCKLLTGIVGYNDRSMICAHEYHTDACGGDSGGPMFVETKANRYVILGVISFGEGCATQYPGIYAKVDEPETLLWLKTSLKGDICYDPPIRRFSRIFLYNDEFQ